MLLKRPRHRTEFLMGLCPSGYLGTRTYVHPIAAEALGLDVDQTDEESIKAAAAVCRRTPGRTTGHFISAMDIQFDRAREGARRGTKHVDNSISKTCNGAKDDTVESVDDFIIWHANSAARLSATIVTAAVRNRC